MPPKVSPVYTCSVVRFNQALKLHKRALDSLLPFNVHKAVCSNLGLFYTYSAHSLPPRSVAQALILIKVRDRRKHDSYQENSSFH